MADVSFKKSTTVTGADLYDYQNLYPIDDGTIYVTKDQEMYLDSEGIRYQIAGNIIYQDPEESFTNPDALIKGSFDGHSIDDFVLRKDLGDLNFDFVPLSGGEMIGDLILNGNPTQANQAATKQYVDNSAPKIYREDIVIGVAQAGLNTLPIPSNIQDYDNMMVYQNGLLLLNPTNFTIDTTNKMIILNGYTFNENETITFTGPLYANANLKGDPGESVTHKWDGTVLTITSASGTSSVDLRGPIGEPGKNGTNGTNGTNGVSPTVAWDPANSRLKINNNGSISYSDSLKMTYSYGPNDPPTGLSAGQLYFVYE